MIERGLLYFFRINLSNCHRCVFIYSHIFHLFLNFGLYSMHLNTSFYANNMLCSLIWPYIILWALVTWCISFLFKINFTVKTLYWWQINWKVYEFLVAALDFNTFGFDIPLFIWWGFCKTMCCSYKRDYFLSALTLPLTGFRLFSLSETLTFLIIPWPEIKYFVNLLGGHSIFLDLNILISLYFEIL